jgi:hypothetical protein
VRERQRPSDDSAARTGSQLHQPAGQFCCKAASDISYPFKIIFHKE